jgi:hypothetical protein
MFHVYVLTAAPRPDGRGRKTVDMGRAQFLMDKELLREAIDHMDKQWPALKAGGGSSKEQGIWEVYCAKHHDKYGEHFRPHVDTNWE